MSAVYITEPGAVIRRSDQHLVVLKGKEKLAHLIPFKIDHLLIFGRAQITTEALELLLKEGVDVAFLSQTGKLRGRLVATESKNMILRLAQYERHQDETFKLDLARTIVKGKLRNGRAFIRHFQRNHSELQIDNEIAQIDKIVKKLNHQITVNALMGSEGMATAIYFRVFGKMFRRELAFEVRTRRPPKDPVNAVLSLGYTLLTNEILALLIAHGFDPYIGFLHGIEYGRPSLALDLIEEFRHPVIDRFALNLFNKQIFTANDFRPVEGEGVYLNPEALKTFFRHYEKRMQETFQYQNETTYFRKLLKQQIQLLNKKIQFNQPYHPFKLRE